MMKNKKNPEPIKGSKLKATPIKPKTSMQDASEAVISTFGGLFRGLANTKKRGQLAVAGGSRDKMAEMQSRIDAIKQSKKTPAKPMANKKAPAKQMAKNKGK